MLSVAAHVYIPLLRAQRQVALCEFDASLLHIKSSCQEIVAQAFNTNTREAEAGQSGL